MPTPCVRRLAVLVGAGKQPCRLAIRVTILPCCCVDDCSLTNRRFDGYSSHPCRYECCGAYSQRPSRGWMSADERRHCLRREFLTTTAQTLLGVEIVGSALSGRAHAATGAEVGRTFCTQTIDDAARGLRSRCVSASTTAQHYRTFLSVHEMQARRIVDIEHHRRSLALPVKLALVHHCRSSRGAGTCFVRGVCGVSKRSHPFVQ